MENYINDSALEILPREENQNSLAPFVERRDNALDVLDFFLKDRSPFSARLRLQTAMFILNKIYPDKSLHGFGEDNRSHFILVFPDGSRSIDGILKSPAKEMPRETKLLFRAGQVKPETEKEKYEAKAELAENEKAVSDPNFLKNLCSNLTQDAQTQTRSISNTPEIPILNQEKLEETSKDDEAIIAAIA